MSDALSAPTIFPSLVNDTSDAVDAIVNGHTHQLYAWTGGAAQDPSGLNEHPGRPVIQAQAYGAYVGQIDLTWDPVTSQVVDADAQVIPPVAAGDVDLTLGNMQAIADHVAQALAEADVLGAPTVAAISADITTAFGGGVWVSDLVNSTTYQNTGDAIRDDRASESALATLVADAFLDTANSSPVVGGADIGIINAGGGLRAELLYALANGTIAYKDANAILPFANNLWTIELTGAQFKQFLEEQWQTAADGSRPTRAFLATGVSSNVTFTVNTDQPGADPCTLEEACAWDDPGSHITSVFINGEPLDPDKSYKILTISFLTNGGGDNYRVMNEGTNAQDTGLLDRDAWIAYLMKASGTAEVGGAPTTPIAPSFARASVVVSNLTPATAPMASTVVQPGGHVSATLSRLNLTSLGSPANTSADIYLVGVGATGADGFLGTVPVTAPGDTAGCADAGVPGTLNPASTGCAAFDVVIPPNTAEGTYTLRVVVQPSGTTVSLPLTVVLPAGQPSALTSTVVIDTANSTATGGAARLADGKDSYTLTVTLKDSTGAALPGMASHLSGHTPDGATVSAFTDQGNGVYTATVTAAQPGRHTAWVSVDDRALGATLATAFIGTVPVAGATAGQVPVAGAGFQPDEPVSVTIDGKPLGTFPADSTGHVTITAALPSGLAVGSHQIELAGPASGKVVGTFTVSSGAKSETGGYVAPTGPLTALAILLFASGAVLVVAHRRLSSIR
jgi:5'-nucleotidase